MPPAQAVAALSGHIVFQIKVVEGGAVFRPRGSLYMGG